MNQPVRPKERALDMKCQRTEMRKSVQQMLFSQRKKRLNKPKHNGVKKNSSPPYIEISGKKSYKILTPAFG